MKYNPEYTCLLVGAKNMLDNGGYESAGGDDGKSLLVDAALLLGNDPYRYPDNLPIVGAKGGPGGKPGCGSLPDVAKNYPVRQLVTNTGWGTGLDMRPNPGIGFPGWARLLPGHPRGAANRPAFATSGAPAPGPIPYPGAPPYGAPLYAPGRHAAVPGPAAGATAGHAARSRPDSGLGAVRACRRLHKLQPTPLPRSRLPSRRQRPRRDRLLP